MIQLSTKSDFCTQPRAFHVDPEELRFSQRRPRPQELSIPQVEACCEHGAIIYTSCKQPGLKASIPEVAPTPSTVRRRAARPTSPDAGNSAGLQCPSRSPSCRVGHPGVAVGSDFGPTSVAGSRSVSVGAQKSVPIVVTPASACDVSLCSGHRVRRKSDDLGGGVRSKSSYCITSFG